MLLLEEVCREGDYVLLLLVLMEMGSCCCCCCVLLLCRHKGVLQMKWRGHPRLARVHLRGLHYSAVLHHWLLLLMMRSLHGCCC